MSRFVVLLAAAASLASAAPVNVPALTPVELRLRKSVSSATAQANDRVEFEVAEDVRLNGSLLIARGTLAWGTVAVAVPGGRLARKGRLAIDLQAVCLSGVGPLPIQAWRGAEPPAHLSDVEGESLLSLPALPLMLFVQGKNVTMERGAEMTAFTAKEAQVESENASRPSTSCEAAVRQDAVPSSNASTSVMFRSNPVGAEIAVDGRFVGNTPSSLRLSPGEHHISIRVPGRKTWDRVMAITEGGDVNINAQLEELPSQLAAGQSEK